jgi:hypothetical protein
MAMPYQLSRGSTSNGQALQHVFAFSRKSVILSVGSWIWVCIYLGNNCLGSIIMQRGKQI